MTGPEAREHVIALERGLAVIRAFGRETPTMTLAEVARATALSRATARRFLHTLETLGYVATDGRTWSLQARVLDLGYAYLSSASTWEVVQSHLENLVADVRESSSASVLDGGDIIYTVRVATQRILSTNIDIGSRLPAYATSMGRVLLSALDEPGLDAFFGATELLPLTPRTITDEHQLREVLGDVRRQGYCLLDSELEQGVRSVAAPLRDARDTVFAAVNVSSHASRVTLDSVRKVLLPAVLNTADSIHTDLVRRR